MEIDKELILKVASVARLKLSDEEAEKFVPQLKEVLAAFSIIDKADTKDAKPSFHPVELKNALRPDEAGECLSQEDALSNTEHKKDGYFKGPRAV